MMYITNAMRGISSPISALVSEAEKLCRAFMEFKLSVIVENDRDYYDFFNNVSRYATQNGMTVCDAINMSTTFARCGYSFYDLMHFFNKTTSSEEQDSLDGSVAEEAPELDKFLADFKVLTRQEVLINQ